MQRLPKHKALTPKEIALYANKNGGIVHTRQIIALGLKEGTIRARAAHTWKSPDLLLAKAWRSAPSRNYPKPTTWSQEHDISRNVWLSSVCWLDDTMGWDFKRNRLYVTKSLNPVRRVMLEKVRFHGGDLKKVLAAGFLDFDSSSRDQLPKLDSHRRFWHEVVRLATNRGTELRSSQLGRSASNEAVLENIEAGIRLEDTLLANENEGLADIGEVLAARHPYGLSSQTALEEIDMLRKALKLKRPKRPDPW